MIDETPQTLEITYPASYMFRFIVKSSPDVAQRFRAIVAAIVGQLPEDDVELRPSGRGNYVAVHLKCQLASEDQRRDVYAALKSDPDHVMSL